MGDDSNKENELPPKLNLRSKVITPSSANPEALASVAAKEAEGTSASSAVPSPAPEPTAPASAPITQKTMRINIPAPTAAPAAAPLGSPTLNKPLNASQPQTPGTPPESAAKTSPTQEPAVPASAPTTQRTMRIDIPAPTAARSAAPADSPTLKKPLDTSQPQAPGTPPQSAAGPTPDTSAARPVIRPAMAPKTIKLKKPVPLGIKRDTPDPAAPVGSKRATSKISLPLSPAAQPTADATTPQPIQISKPTPSPAAIKPADAKGSAKIGTPAPATPLHPAPDPKRQTSRISLNSVLGSESDSGPKTIKLKRPSTITAQGVPPTSSDAQRKTAPSDQATASGSDADTPDTQKKTIKVKRPSGRPSLRKSAASDGDDSDGSATGGRDASTLFTPPSKMDIPAESAHWFFIVTGCAATIITGVLIYVLCAQAFGPNLSLTKLSYGAPNMELPWPNRITR